MRKILYISILVAATLLFVGCSSKKSTVKTEYFTEILTDTIYIERASVQTVTRLDTISVYKELVVHDSIIIVKDTAGNITSRDHTRTTEITGYEQTIRNLTSQLDSLTEIIQSRTDYKDDKKEESVEKTTKRMYGSIITLLMFVSIAFVLILGLRKLL